MLFLVGYIDLKMTVHEYKDIIEKEADGDLVCNGGAAASFSISNKSKQNQIIRRPKHFNIMSMINGLDDSILTWNCSYATKILRACSEDKIFEGNHSGKKILHPILAPTQMISFLNF